VRAGQAPAQGVDPLLVCPDQALESVHVSLLGFPDEDGILRMLVRSRRSSHWSYTSRQNLFHFHDTLFWAGKELGPGAASGGGLSQDAPG
jgi:hypothetical protein